MRKGLPTSFILSTLCLLPALSTVFTSIVSYASPVNIFSRVKDLDNRPTVKVWLCCSPLQQRYSRIPAVSSVLGKNKCLQEGVLVSAPGPAATIAAINASDYTRAGPTVAVYEARTLNREASLLPPPLMLLTMQSFFSTSTATSSSSSSSTLISIEAEDESYVERPNANYNASCIFVDNLSLFDEDWLCRQMLNAIRALAIPSTIAATTGSELQNKQKPALLVVYTGDPDSVPQLERVLMRSWRIFLAQHEEALQLGEEIAAAAAAAAAEAEAEAEAAISNRNNTGFHKNNVHETGGAKNDRNVHLHPHNRANQMTLRGSIMAVLDVQIILAGESGSASKTGVEVMGESVCTQLEQKLFKNYYKMEMSSNASMSSNATAATLFKPLAACLREEEEAAHMNDQDGDKDNDNDSFKTAALVRKSGMSIRTKDMIAGRTKIPQFDLLKLNTVVERVVKNATAYVSAESIRQQRVLQQIESINTPQFLSSLSSSSLLPVSPLLLFANRSSFGSFIGDIIFEAIERVATEMRSNDTEEDANVSDDSAVDIYIVTSEVRRKIFPALFPFYKQGLLLIRNKVAKHFNDRITNELKISPSIDQDLNRLRDETLSEFSESAALLLPPSLSSSSSSYSLLSPFLAPITATQHLPANWRCDFELDELRASLDAFVADRVTHYRIAGVLPRRNRPPVQLSFHSLLSPQTLGLPLDYRQDVVGTGAHSKTDKFKVIPATNREALLTNIHSSNVATQRRPHALKKLISQRIEELQGPPVSSSNSNSSSSSSLSWMSSLRRKLFLHRARKDREFVREIAMLDLSIKNPGVPMTIGGMLRKQPQRKQQQQQQQRGGPPRDDNPLRLEFAPERLINWSLPVMQEVQESMRGLQQQVMQQGIKENIDDGGGGGGGIRNTFRRFWQKTVKPEV